MGTDGTRGTNYFSHELNELQGRIFHSVGRVPKGHRANLRKRAATSRGLAESAPGAAPIGEQEYTGAWPGANGHEIQVFEKGLPFDCVSIIPQRRDLLWHLNA